MDEYDVFLDEISRMRTLDELQLYAFLPSQRGRQFLVITPNSLKNVKVTNDVKVIKLKDPNQGAVSAHGLQQTTLEETF